MRIVFAGGGTGGHLYPGLAIARALVRIDATIQPHFVGAVRGVERDVLPRTEFPHTLLDLHPLYRRRVWENWRTVRGAAGGWRALGAIARNQPLPLVVGTGGYAAGLMLAYAASHHIPYVLQEANSYPGLTQRLFSRWAREVYLGYPEAEARMPHRGAAFLDTGNPIEPPPTGALRPSREDARARWGFRGVRQVLLVFGGSQGARGINVVVDAWLRRPDALPDGLGVIWGTGASHYDTYASHESDRVRVRPFLSPIADAYAAADLALTRAGAMTTAELCAWGIPMILVPLPTAAADHQTANARSLEAAGAAMHIPQRLLDADGLGRAIRNLASDPAALRLLTSKALERGRPDAADVIARRILTLVHLKQIRS